MRLHNKYGKAWLKDFKKALECPTFKYTPHKKQKPIDDYRYTKEEKAILREAQLLKKNH